MKIIFAVAVCLLTVGCASNGSDVDPYESFNRSVYSFNRAVDKAVLKPVAEGYREVAPEAVEVGVDNFFSNIGDVGNMINNVLQFKLLDASSDLGRLLVNTTLGIGGLFDPASAMGLEKHDEDFGQTLASWGVGSGAYVMLPFLGPSTLRDTFAIPADNYIDPITDIEDNATRYGLAGMRLLNTRVGLLDLDQQLESSLDEYLFVRDAYLQNRKFRVFDGDIPFEDDFDCDPEYEDC